jgi:hypothetical protein
MSTPQVGRPVRGSKTGRPIMAALDLLGRRSSLRILWELRAGSALTFRALQDAAQTNPSLLNTAPEGAARGHPGAAPGRGLPAHGQRQRAAGRAAAAVRLGAALGPSGARTRARPDATAWRGG